MKNNRNQAVKKTKYKNANTKRNKVIEALKTFCQMGSGGGNSNRCG